MRLLRPLNQLLALLAMAATGSIAGAQTTVLANVTQLIADITSKPMYQHTSWGFMIVDQNSGETLLDTMGAKMYVPGSIMKTYSTSSALKVYGPDYRFRTPVYKTGMVDGGALDENLVLVASGDFSFGLRERPGGKLAYNSLPEIDHNYASTGFAGVALVKNSNPLAALDRLAAQVRAADIRRIRGNVLIDDRLFKAFDGWPDGVIAPIWVNENDIDITSTATRPGQPASLTWRPKTAAIRVVSTVTTAPVGTQTSPLTVATISPGVVQVSGKIAADAKPIISGSDIPKPSDFARTAFIEALHRAGVLVDARATGPNPKELLPSATSYTERSKIAEHISPPFSEFIKVILFEVCALTLHPLA
ncbi:MAG: D-alanyl-D-alanine carboxypeptidase [Candidatus Baltobacteraceae bacterium]